jgi:leucine dehydrogenase
MFDNASFDGHEHVSFFSDAGTGLKGLIAIHSSALGPAMGGCRVWTYADASAALTDALRLSRGMSYKNAIAGLPLGGGKAVILRDAGAAMSDAAFEAFGDAVERLGGRYVTAEDVGVSERSMVAVSRRTRFVSGLPRHAARSDVGGDPSPWTAMGVFVGLRAAVKARLARNDLAGVPVAVQGLGNVGRHLCRLLHEAGARLVVADVDPQAVEDACTRFGATAVSVDEILAADVDVVAPCALGGVLHRQSIARLRARVVAGAANNQLACDDDGQRLFEAGVLYAPDYVINAGGIISAGLEYLGETDLQRVSSRVAGIAGTLEDIFERSRATGTATHRIADAMARERLARGASRRSSPAKQAA